MRLEIVNGQIVDPYQNLDSLQNLYIDNGKIIHIGRQPPATWKSDQRIEAKNLIICPGLIDLCVRLREPGFEYKATLESEIAAATASGVTHLVCPPDTDPPLDEPGLVEMIKHRALQLNQAQVYPLGALTQGLQGEAITEMSELFDAGCIGFAQMDAPLTNHLVLYRAMQYAATFGFTLWFRPQDYYLAKDGILHDGETATRLGVPAIPALAETLAIQNILAIAAETGARVHLCRISSQESLPLIENAKARGLPISCDVNIHHLHLTDVDVGYFNPYFHFIPPLRSGRDRQALSKALQQGIIDAICSDHTPIDDDAKQLPIGEAEAGASGVEVLLPLTLRWAKDNGITLLDALRCLTRNPAQILGFQPESHRIAIGNVANLCIFDANFEWQITPQTLRSQGKNSPFLGSTLYGKVRYTVIQGNVISQ